MKRLVELPFRVLAALAELPLSRRGLAVIFLLAAAGLAATGWLRPPLSADLKGLHLPWGTRQEDQPAPEDLLQGPHRLRTDGVGTLLLGLAAAGLPVVLLWPRRVGVVAGLLLGGALAGNAAAALNHPALIELLDQEYEQRLQMNSVMRHTPGVRGVANPRNGRIGVGGAPKGDEQPGDPARGWEYLLYGRWLVVWAAVGVLVGGAGSLPRRLLGLGAWTALGLGLAGGVCLPRLRAEYHWLQARQLEGACRPAAARQALQAAVALCPELGRLERTWLLAGKLDYRTARRTAEERYFRAYQLARDRELPRVVAYAEDLPWLLTGVPDFREGRVPLPVGFDLGIRADAAGARDYTAGRASLQGPLVRTYRAAQGRQFHQALALMDELAAGEGRGQPAVLNQTARLWSDLAIKDYFSDPTLGYAGLHSVKQDRYLLPALDAWRRARKAQPNRRDYAFYVGTLQARLNPACPDRVAACYTPVLDDLADRTLRADVLNYLGDAYGRAGQLGEARRWYAESIDAFHLPKKLNYRAQKGLGGL